MNNFEPLGADKIAALRTALQKAVRQLTAKANDPDWEVRMAVLETLNDGAMEMQRLLFRTFRDRQELVRATAMEIAGDFRVGHLSWESSRRMAKDRSPLVRSLAARALGEMFGGYPSADPRKALAASARDRDDEVKASAYYGLARLGDDRYFRLFLNGLRHPFYRIRAATANQLPDVLDAPRRTLALKALRTSRTQK